MTRSCCVQGCKSGKIVPSHGIPTNKERRKRWLQILKLNITDEDVIKQLRVCHKHFHENDYSCNPRYRRLINTAVPCMELACPEEVGTQLQQEAVFQQQTEMTISQKGEEIQERMEVLHQQQERMKVLYHQQQQEIEVLHQQQEERMEMLSQKQDEIQERMEMLHHEQEERIEMMSQEQEEIQERMEMLYHEREERMKMLSQKQEEIQERMEMLHYQQQEKIEVLSQKQEEIEKQLIKDNKHTLSARRPNLLKITRQSTLNSQARLFYQKVIKLQRDQRRLKQMVRKMKQERTSNRITLSTTDHRGRKDKT